MRVVLARTYIDVCPALLRLILGNCFCRWTFGALMYEMLTGEPPFTAGSIKELLHVIVNNPVVIPDKIRSKSTLAADCIEQLLHKVRLLISFNSCTITVQARITSARRTGYRVSLKRRCASLALFYSLI